ncbi:MAG: PfkB family carbohydrate kinase [Erysipelotrichaceae bacterium]|nr:PfkB family carbohydrate kinase [Erysipelotrichaceae bacterium]
MKCICVGDNVIDYYRNLNQMYPGGNAVNVAVHLSKLGVESTYLGNIGDDEMSNVIRKALVDNNVNFDRCVTIKNGTTKHCVYDVVNGERTFIEVRLGDNWSGAMTLSKQDIDYINEYDAIFMSVNSKMQDEIIKLKDTKSLFIYDFGEKEKYHTDEYLNTVCFNIDLAMLSLQDDDPNTMRVLADKLLKRNTKNILFTIGKKGQYLYNKSGIYYGKSKLVDAIDTMGAGDSFLAAFVIEAINKGFEKGIILNKQIIEYALDKASDNARKNCLVKGAF